jgi:hypothetical protein
MITSSKHLHPYLKIVGVIILFGLTSGCALGRWVLSQIAFLTSKNWNFPLFPRRDLSFLLGFSGL